MTGLALRQMVRRLRRDARGVTALEFALAAPVMLLIMAVLLELGLAYYVQAVLTGTINAAGRDSSLQSAQTSTTTIDSEVTTRIQHVVPWATVSFSRRNYTDFTNVGQPEVFTDSNKNDGGDLGWFGKGRMVKEFEDAAFALEKGAYSKTPVKSEFGFHIIKVEDKRIAPPPPFEQVEAQVRNLVIRDKYLDLLNKAKEGSKVEISDETLRKGYEEATKQ